MKENILYLFVLFFMVACGAQNNPSEDVTSLSNATDDTVSIDTEVFQGSTIVLPKSLAIDFPNALKESSNTSFNENVNRIQKVIDSEKYNLELLALAIEEISNDCPDSNTTCHFEDEHFRVNHNHQTIVLGEIYLTKYKVEDKSGYDLTLNLNDGISVQYEWVEDENNVFTTYEDGNNSVKLHYFRESNQSEASYIDESLINEKNSFMINRENNGSSIYLLTSNHIKDNKQEFSSSLRVEDTVLIEDNASFFNVSNDSNDTEENGLSLTLGVNSLDARVNTIESIVILNFIEEQDLKEGDYLLFTSEVEVETLNLFEKLKLAIGHFTYFKGEVFGLSINDLDSEKNSELQIIPLK